MTEWKDDDEFTTTFGTLKRSMAEAGEAERERIIALLEPVLAQGDGLHYDVKNVLALIRGEV